MKKISLSQNKSAIVDDEDFDFLNQFKWFADKIGNTFYATRSLYLGGGKYNRKTKKIIMHRIIMKASKDQIIHHKNGNGLDNRKDNLIFCTRNQNIHHQKKRKAKTSKYIGVSWDKNLKKWVAKIGFNKKLIHIGYFDDEVKAAKKYDEKAKELYGEFANINFKNCDRSRGASI